MSNGNRTRNTACDICLCLRKFLCSEVNILKSGNTIPNTIYFCLLFCDRRSGKCCCISKIQVLLDARYVVFLSHLLIAGCDIGVQISVRPFVRPSVNIYVEVLFSRHQR